MDGRADGRLQGRTDGRTDAQISPVFYRTLSSLGPLPCLLSHCHRHVNGQGKGTADHLLPLGDWFSLFLSLFLSFYGQPGGRMDGISPCVLQNIVPYWVHCPAYTQPWHYCLWQDKGTADLLMLLGNLFRLVLAHLCLAL